MSDGLDVDSDFKKARAFLIAYSTLILLLWYFSAELSAISVFGNTIKFKENTNNAWLIASFVNLYFLLRFIQRSPVGSFAPDDDLRRTTDLSLILLCRKWYARMIDNHANSAFSSIRETQPDIALCKITQVRTRGSMHYWGQIKKDKDKDRVSYDGVLSHRQIYNRRAVVFTVGFSYRSDGKSGSASASDVIVSAALGLVLLSRIFGFIKAVLFSPWFTDYIIPVLYSLAAVSVGLFAWWQLNY